jgi:hypothetical protein
MSSNPPEVLLSIASDMFIKGWQPVWCLARTNGAYTPIPGTTGGSSPFPAVEPQPQGPHRLAFRPPPDVVIFDVDHYDAKRGADTMDRAEEWLGELPLTYKVTSRGYDNPSGRLLFRKPADLDFTDNALAQFGDEDGHTSVEVVRTSHRFSWAPGDTNHKNGLMVTCFNPEGDACLLPDVSELPELPQRWVDYLRNPPIPYAQLAYTRPADGPQWWLAQADQSLGSRAELAQFAFDLIASRLLPDEAMVQLRRVARVDDPARPWLDEHLTGLVDGNTERKALALAERVEASYDELPATRYELQEIAQRTQTEFDNKQLLAASLEPQVPFDPGLFQEITHAAGVTAPGEDAKDVPVGHLLRRLPEFDRLLWNELARHQARKDAAVILAGQFTGYQDIADLPDPPEPETLHIVGRDTPGTRLIGRSTITVISGHRSSGKTWAVATWAAQELRYGTGKVIWLDFERQDMLLNAKFKALKIGKHLIKGGLQYSSSLPPADRLVRDIKAASNYGQFRVLLVVDAFRTLQGIVVPESSANDGDAVEQVYVQYLTPAVEAGANVILLDHVSKGGGTTFGSERKESAPDYVIQVAKCQGFSKKRAGYASLTVTKDRYGNTDDTESPCGYLWVPGDGSSSGASITQYPDVPELRNWAPEDPLTLGDISSSDKSAREQVLTAMVAGDRLKLSINKLARDAMEAYPEMFKAESSTKRYIRDMINDGKLSKEEGTQGRLDIAVKEVHSPAPAIDPKMLEHPEE